MFVMTSRATHNAASGTFAELTIENDPIARCFVKNASSFSSAGGAATSHVAVEPASSAGAGAPESAVVGDVAGASTVEQARNVANAANVTRRRGASLFSPSPSP